MANGYDEHSIRTAAKEAASSSDVAPLVAVKDKRFTRSGIGYRSQSPEASEASAFGPGQLGSTPPPIMYPGDYPGGTAARKRGQVDEAKLPWQTAQEATSKPDRPRDTLPPGLEEGLPPWLKDKGKSDDEEGDDKSGKDGKKGKSAPPWLNKGKDGAKSKGKGMKENWLDGEDQPVSDCEGFPGEWEARDALSTLSQFVDANTLKAIQNQIAKQYGDPAEDGDEPPVPGYMGESGLREAPLDAKKRDGLDDSDFALAGRKYPIDTPERARSALARVKQFGKTGEEAKVKAAVRKKYPDMKVD